MKIKIEFIQRVAKLVAFTLFPLVFSPCFGQAQDENSDENEDIATLSVFEVNASKDVGYQAGMAITATRIGTAIIDTPLNVQVVTSQFLEDLNIDRIGESVHYVSGALGDDRIFDTGGIRLRGQPSGSPFRNGYQRARSIGTENVERIEVVKGPTTVFFGAGNPGGIINYITKRPVFQNKFSLKYTYGSYDFNKVQADAQIVLGDDKTAGARIFASYEDSEDFRDFETREVKYLSPSFRWRPSAAFELSAEFEYRRQTGNEATVNLAANPAFLADWANPPQDVQDATGRDAANLQDRWRISDSRWAGDVEATRGGRPFRITEYVNELSPRGLKFNPGGPDAFETHNADAFNLEAKFHPADWLDLRYGFSWVETEFEDIEVPITVNGDGTIRSDRVRSRPASSETYSHQLDLLLNFNFAGVENKLIVGFERVDDETLNRNRSFDFNLEDDVLDAAGNTLSGRNVWRFWDPMIHEPLSANKILTGFSSAFSTGDTERNAYYITHQGTLFDGRLHTMAGVRYTDFKSQGANQNGPLDSNEINATVPMVGVNFRIFDGFSFFASYSENFIPTFNISATGPGVQPGEAFLLPPESAAGWDIGIKTDWMDNKLSGTFTVFQLERQDLARNDIAKREADPRNNDSDPDNDIFFVTTSGLERSQGLELDLIWTPNTNYQLLLAYSYTWDAKLVSNPALEVGSVAEQVLIGRRLRTAPDHLFSMFNKYTFSKGPLKGVSLGGGFRYTGEHGPLNHNFQFNLINESSFIVDAFIGYKTKVGNSDVSFMLNFENLTDSEYFVGNRAAGDPLKVFLSSKITF